MFQFIKKGTAKSIKPPTLPNSYGTVRTFKKDFESFGRTGAVEDTTESEILPFRPAEKSPGFENHAPKDLLREVPLASDKKTAPENLFQSVPTPPPVPLQNPDLPPFKSSPSQNFFEEKPVSQENILPQVNESRPEPRKSGKRLALLLLVILLLAAAGAGLYYYWFHIRNNPASSPSPANQTDSSASQTDSSSSDLQNKNLHRLRVDISSQTGREISAAVQKFASDFSGTAAENELAEIKIIGQDEQLIGKKDLFAGIGADIPETVSSKLSEDYSLFARKEKGAVKLGLVFKTVTSSGLAAEMKNWESKMASGINALFLEQALSPPAPAFNSGRYKNADIRYSNFSSPPNTSLDYSIISNFLVIGTSKDSMRAILDYMAGK